MIAKADRKGAIVSDFLPSSRILLSPITSPRHVAYTGVKARTHRFFVAVAVSVSGSVAATAPLNAERLVLFCQFTTIIEQGPRTFSQSLSLFFSVSLTTHLSLSLSVYLFVFALSLICLYLCRSVCLFPFAVVVLSVVFVCLYVYLSLRHVHLFSGLWAIWAYDQTI